jgi:DNA sulfur modification protein DndC
MEDEVLMLEVPSAVQAFIEAGALFVVNNSGGKDSQAMQALLRQIVPASQLLVIHAHLEGEEWSGTWEHVLAMSKGLRTIKALPTKTFEQMVEHRGMFPSPANRQCTSDLKRGPIEREIRRFLKDHPEFGGQVINCMGMRAQESPARSKLQVWKKSAGNSIAGRTWYDWLPIHDLTVEQVFQVIAGAGQTAHWAYAAGASRLSCMFCIMASKADLTVAARLNPEAYAQRVRLERRVGHTINMGGVPLDQVVGIPLAAEQPDLFAA